MRWLLTVAWLLAGCDKAEPVGVACGASLTCTGGDVCIERAQDASCTGHEDTGEACPDGTTATSCGGIGYPCCCGEAPPPVYECYTPIACTGTPTCDCVVLACENRSECTPLPEEGDATFRCELPSVE